MTVYSWRELKCNISYLSYHWFNWGSLYQTSTREICVSKLKTTQRKSYVNICIQNTKHWRYVLLVWNIRLRITLIGLVGVKRKLKQQFWDFDPMGKGLTGSSKCLIFPVHPDECFPMSFQLVVSWHNHQHAVGCTGAYMTHFSLDHVRREIYILTYSLLAWPQV